jgi:hypothetical protein
MPNPSQNSQSLQCGSLTSSASALAPAFGASGGFDYSSVSQSAWSFTQGGAEPFELNGTNSNITAQNAVNGNPGFYISSLSQVCNIEASATLVTGFYTCNTLNIKARSQPLQIIGTFIVGKLIVDPSAETAGITWSSIYNSNSVYVLRNVGILKTLPGSQCDDPTQPLWNPIPSLQNLYSVFYCTPLSLRHLADPFTWSEVNPLCGLQCNGGQCSGAVTCNLRDHSSRLQQAIFSRSYQI